MAKKTKATKLSKVKPPRLRTSPYTSNPATLRFGSSDQSYYLPEVLLEKLENFQPCFDCNGQTVVHLPDVDANTGHVLIHYLHTATYQTLDDSEDGNIDDEDSSVASNEFRKAVEALDAAQRYGLTGLQQLAQSEIERRGADLDLHGVVNAIKEKFVTGPSHEHAWLRDYVSQKSRSTFRDDPELFSRPDFFESIESPTLIKELAQIMVGLYCKQIVELRQENAASRQAPVLECSGSAVGSDPSNLSQLPSRRPAPHSSAWPASPEKFGAFDDSVAAWDPLTLELNHIDTPEADAPGSMPSSGKKDRKGERLQGTKELSEANVSRADVPTAPPETAVALMKNGSTNPNGATVEDLTVSKIENVAASIDDPLQPTVERLGVEASLPIDAVVEAVNPWGFSTSTTNKKKKKSRLMTRLSSRFLVAEPTPEVEPTPEAEPIPEAESISEAEPIIEVEPDPNAGSVLEAEPATEAPTGDRFVGLSRIKKKRLEKTLWAKAAAHEQAGAERSKLKKEAKLNKREKEEAEARRLEKEAAAAVPAETEAEETKSEVMWDVWDNPAWVPKRKKKSKKGASTALDLPETPAPPPSPPAEPESDPQCDSVIFEAVTEDAPAVAESKLVDKEDPWGDWGVVASSSKKGKTLAGWKAPPPELEVVVESDPIEPEPESSVDTMRACDPATEVVAISSSVDCPSRQEHLSESDGWKSCKLCELYVRQIALKLHSAALSDVNGSDVTQ